MDVGLERRWRTNVMGFARHGLLPHVLAASLWADVAHRHAPERWKARPHTGNGLHCRLDAVFEAVLEDVSRADAVAEVIGRARIDPAGQPPFRFEIAYQDAMVRPGHRYAVRATVRHRGRLLFASDRGYPVLAGGNAPLEILLVRAEERR